MKLERSVEKVCKALHSVMLALEGAGTLCKLSDGNLFWPEICD